MSLIDPAFRREYDPSRSWQVEKLEFLLNASRKAASKAENSRLYNIIRVLEQSHAVSYILDSKHRLVYTNPAWDSFARSNNAPQLAGETIIGFDIFDAIAEPLKAVYTDAFRRIAETGAVWGKTYTCSSPEQVRRYRMKIYFMEQRNWFLVTNSLLSKTPHRILTMPKKANTSKGASSQCAHIADVQSGRTDPMPGISCLNI